MIRLLMGITLSEVGGSQQVVFNIISNLPENMYDITLLTAPGGELINWVDELNKNRINIVRVITLSCIRRDISLYHDLILFLKLLSILKKSKYDIVHFHNSKMGILGRLAAKIKGIPKIYYTVHGWGLNKNTTGPIFPILGVLERIVACFSTRIIFVSKKDYDYGIQNGWAFKSKSCLIYNGISDECFITDSSRKYLEKINKEPIIAFTARLSEPKDPLFAIRVSEQLLRDGYNHKLILIGDGPKHTDCRNLIRLLNIDNHVILLGKRNDVIDLLREADIFCLFSKWEGLPISIIEAMACGIPVVASGVGGIPELIEHGKSGYLLYDSSIERAAAFLEDLIGDKERRMTFGNAAKIAALKKFNLAGMVSDYRQLYEER